MQNNQTLKIVNWIFTAIITLILVNLALPFAEATIISASYNNIKIVVDGKMLATEKEPFIYNGTTYLPVRAVGEAVGKAVSWDNNTSTVYLLAKTEATETTPINKAIWSDKNTSPPSSTALDVTYRNIKIVVDNQTITTAQEPFIYAGTTYLPVRAVGEAVGKTVNWDSDTQTVYLGQIPDYQKQNINLNQNVVIIEDFQQNHQWTASAGDFEVDKDNYSYGKQSVKLTTVQKDEYATMQSGSAAYNIDLTNSNLCLTLKCNDINNFRRFNIFAGTNGFSDYYKWVIIPKATTGNSQNLITNGDWVTISFSLANASINGSPNPKNLTDLKIQIQDDGIRTSVNLQKIETTATPNQPFSHGVVSIVFDDGRRSVYETALPLLEAAGIRSTAFLITAYQNAKYPDYMSWDQVRSLQYDYNWELGGHAGYRDTHGADLGLVDLTETQIKADFEQIIQDFKTQALKRPWGYAYPKGCYNSLVENLTQQYFTYGRTVISGVGSETIPPSELFRLRAYSAISSNPDGLAIAKITGNGGILDQCAANGNWTILVFHDIINTEPSSTDQCKATDFKAILDSINEKGIKCLPIEEVLSNI